MGREPTSGSWMLTRRFQTPDEALRVYEKARDLILGHLLESSVYRVTFDGNSFVVVIGELPLDRQQSDGLGAVLSTGVEDRIPGTIIEELQRRRDEFRETGASFIERRTRYL